MQTNLDRVEENVEGLLPWDLTFIFKGTQYPTARPTLGLSARLQNLDALGNKQSLELLGSLFVDPKPDFLSMTPPQVSVILVQYLIAFNESIAKNSLAIVANAKKAAVAQQA